MWASEKFQQVKVLAVKHDPLRSVPGAWVVEGENQFLYVVLLPQCATGLTHVNPNVLASTER